MTQHHQLSAGYCLDILFIMEFDAISFGLHESVSNQMQESDISHQQELLLQ